jgi:membrane associated rhomboid family serine protease
MRASGKVPFATLTLALLITIIQVFRLSGGSYDEFISANLKVVNWELLFNQPWRTLTSPFIHHNPLHFLENLFFLLLFGRQIEKTHGWAILLGVFFGALVAGHVIRINVMHDWLVGISGGVCGLFGVSLIANRRTPWWTTLTHRPLHALYSINLLWAVIVDMADWVPFPVAHLNHVVGILYGVAFGITFLLTPRRDPWRAVVIALPLLLFASQFYSPWQVERRLLKSQPLLVTAGADCQLSSAVQDTYVPASIKFVNASTKPVAIYWLDYEGNAKFQLWLRPGATRPYNSFVDHPWCIVDVDREEALQAVIVTETEQTITIP